MKRVVLLFDQLQNRVKFLLIRLVYLVFQVNFLSQQHHKVLKMVVHLNIDHLFNYQKLNKPSIYKPKFEQKIISLCKCQSTLRSSFNFLYFFSSVFCSDIYSLYIIVVMLLFFFISLEREIFFLHVFASKNHYR